MTRRSRGDMRSCLRWFAPCAASSGSSTASLVSEHSVRFHSKGMSHYSFKFIFNILSEPAAEKCISFKVQSLSWFGV